MKLLVLIHRLPCPADGGSKLRAAAQLRYLAPRHDVWCAGFLDARPARGAKPEVRKALTKLRSCCREVAPIPLRPPIARARAFASLLAGGTGTEGYFASRALKRRVMRWGEEIGFDAVLAFSSSMAPLALEVPAARRVLDLDDLDSIKWAQSVQYARPPMKWIYRIEARRLARRERDWLATFDASVLISEREAALISDPSLRRRVHVIGPSIPVNVARVGVRAAGAGFKPSPLPPEPIVGFVGAMDYPPNVDAACWFAESIWPRVRARRPDAKCWLVGRSPVRAVRRLDNGESIHVTGTVPAVEPYLERIRVSVAPLRLARGVQIKVLEALTAGRPCVVTPCVAEAIGARAGRDLLAAESPASFADAVVDLLDDRSRAEAIGRAGREFVCNRHRPEEGLRRLEELLCGKVGPHSSGAEPKREDPALLVVA